jgi:hypothetical protein
MLLFQKPLLIRGGQQRAMVRREACPGCGSVQLTRNRPLHTGTQNHQGKACGRPWVLHAEKRVIAEEPRILVAGLLREQISLPGICRAVGVGIKGLMHFMVDRFKAAPDHLPIQLYRTLQQHVTPAGFPPRA